MGDLIEKVKISNLINGNGIFENFKNNSIFFYNLYSKSSKDVLNIPISKIFPGYFYFLHYRDDSNWMKYSPVFVVDFKKFSNLIIVIAVNFNFIPIEIRVSIFDKYITNKDFEDDNQLKVDYEGMYKELIKYGFEYSIVEYNVAQIEFVHKISLSLLPRFLYSQHPINKYDPKKLYEIWKAKISTKEERHREMYGSVISDLFNISNDILENYNVLKDHITRLQRSLDKYGK